MRRRTSGSRRAVLFSALFASVAWLLRRTERDYEERGRLSPEVSAMAWALYLLHAGLTVSTARRPPRSLPFGKTSAAVLGGALALFGCWFSAWGVYEFRSFGQMSGVETGNLVKTGPYRFSYNPQVIGWGLALLGAALAGRSPGALLLVVAYFLVHRLHVPIEEQHLERTFGEEYRRYRTKVPRFLSLPRQR